MGTNLGDGLQIEKVNTPSAPRKQKRVSTTPARTQSRPVKQRTPARTPARRPARRPAHRSTTSASSPNVTVTTPTRRPTTPAPAARKPEPTKRWGGRSDLIAMAVTTNIAREQMKPKLKATRVTRGSDGRVTGIHNLHHGDSVTFNRTR